MLKIDKFAFCFFSSDINIVIEQEKELTKLSDKYGKAYTDFLNQKKKEELNINPLEMLSNIESGVVNFLSNMYVVLITIIYFQ